MFVSRRRYRRDTEALHDQVRRLVDARDGALADALAEAGARTIFVRRLAEADAALARVHGRNRHLAQTLGFAVGQGDADYNRLYARLVRALRGCARYRDELAGQHRLNDVLTDRLLSSLGYDDASLLRLGVDVADDRRDMGEVPG
jgi:hypothetical protein